ncbi:MAG: type III-B CRISPR-associated protein Cas10/Cmr2 [Cyanobacteria bacterium P01_A01_bin.123]
MQGQIYTAITFSPVQDFIEKSRKLRDLYGSSIILSYLADEICRAARAYFQVAENATWPQDPIVSPARIDVARGTPNTILIRGEFPKTAAQDTLNRAWRELALKCRIWIENQVDEKADHQPWQYAWKRPWQEWINHCWEFFWATGSTMDEARKNLNQVKYARAWTGINWVGESSTLSGLDSRAWPTLGFHKSHERSRAEEEAEVKAFYTQLSQTIEPSSSAPANTDATEDATENASIITQREQLSIPELVKRLVTIEDIVGVRSPLELPRTFNQINRWKSKETDDDNTADGTEDADRGESRRWTGWFQGDGDRAGKYLEVLAAQAHDEQKLEDSTHKFSKAMREWGAKLHTHLPRSQKTRKTLDRDGRIIYAGGDDFLGVLYRNPPDTHLTAQECLNWFYSFKPKIWSLHQEPISVSVGFVWAAPNVPQRDVLQHCRLSEKSAKGQGRDRLALRILFNGGNHLEWVCPWRFLPVVQDYCDRTPHNGTDQWTHIYNDVATLESRHAFQDGQDGAQSVVALRLFQVYFKRATAISNAEAGFSTWQESDRDQFYNLMKDGDPDDDLDLDHPALWNQIDSATKQITGGILGDRAAYTIDHTDEGPLDTEKVHDAFNQWIVDLAKVGFHLCRSSSNI